MDSEFNLHSGFRRASMATADRLLRVLKTDAAAFGDEDRTQRPQLTAEERLERMRARQAAR